MITTERELATRLDVAPETLAMAAGQSGGTKAYLRQLIINSGEMRVMGRHPKGTGVEYAFEVFERVMGEPLHPKRKRGAK